MTTLLAWFAICASIGSPLLLLWATGHQRRREKVEDWRRQDEVAAKVATATSAAEAAAKIAANHAEAAGEAVVEANVKLDENKEALGVIHALVNSSMTAALQDQLNARTENLATLNELVRLHQDAGQEPSPETVAAINAAEKKIRELTETLNGRLLHPES